MEIKLSGIEKKYGQKTAVKEINIRIGEGIHGLLGANGAGKTTLLRLICNVMYPTSGEVLLDGKNINELGEQYRDFLGYLPQEFGYYPDFTALEFMCYVAALKGIPGRRAKVRSMGLLESVGLDGFANKKIKTFSGGMRQRLGIAQAVLNNPRILVLDEPTAGLDPKERIRFRNLVKGFSKGRIVILSTHIVSDLGSIADNILLMKEGHIITQGSIPQVERSLEGKVWRYVCTSDADLEKMDKEICVIEKREIEGGFELRVISEKQPWEEAVSVQANLEDVYMYYFHDEVREGKYDWIDKI